MTDQLVVSADQSLDANWWRQAVVYQVYPRSFADSDGDGIGDLPGLTSRIGYLAGLGVDADLAQPVLPVGAGRRRLRRRRLPRRPPAARHAGRLRRPGRSPPTPPGCEVIVDIVPNHTSDLHPWFVEALASPTRIAGSRPLHLPRRHRARRFSSRRRTGSPTSAARPGPGCRTGSGTATCSHREQPDLNWDNREVRDDFLQTLRFWADRGVDGFRVDVAHALAKDLSEPLRSKPVLEDESLPLDGSDPLYDRDEVHEIYAEWRQLFDSYDPPRTAVAEAFAPSARRALYARPTELGQAFNFDLLKADFRRDGVPGRDHLLPRPGGEDRVVVDLGAVQPRRRPARDPLRAADRDWTWTSG